MSDIDDAAVLTIRMRSRGGITTGRHTRPAEAAYLERCTHFHYRTGTLILMTRDTGHHSSGWMKNPDYERCRHVSLSFREPFPERAADQLGNPKSMNRLGIVAAPRPFDGKLAATWIKLLLGDDANYAWCEGAFSPEGRFLGVMHWRVFCDPAWEAILPRGEVYSTEFTEAGWKSWSELQSEANWVSAE